ncbi:MAG: carbohydrate porin, partial [Vicinamibacterales bacterium]|nr:carbohydrate porin [Vicinamibacterales bacterium]
LVSPVARHLGAGIVAAGLVPGRQDDLAGVAVTSIRFGERTDCPTEAGSETNVGAFYKFALTRWLALKPDLQVVFNPAGDTTRRKAIVSTLRFEVGF